MRGGDHADADYLAMLPVQDRLSGAGWNPVAFRGRGKTGEGDTLLRPGFRENDEGGKQAAFRRTGYFAAS